MRLLSFAVMMSQAATKVLACLAWLAPVLGTPTLHWASTPALPGEVAMIAGSNFSLAPSIRLTPLSSPGQGVQIAPLQVTSEAIKFEIPSTLPLDAYSVCVDGSQPFVLNAPDLWWAMGDAGDSATPGGWIRVFGRGLSLAADAQSTHIAKAASEIAAAAARRDFATAQTWAAAAQHATVATKQASQRVVLTLTKIDGTNIQVPAGNATAVSATFDLPAGISLGEYKIEVSNGGAAALLDSFVSPNLPHVSTMVVKAPLSFPGRRFAVKDMGCKGGVNTSGFPINCTEAVHAAIKAAGAAGGGTVYFDVGRWYISGALLLPEGVLLKGAGRDLTAIYFAQDNETTAPNSYITAAPGGRRFGLEDLAVYVLSFYRNLINIAHDTDGVRIRRIRVRANAFHCRKSNTRQPRPVAWPFGAAGDWPLIKINGANFEVSDSDIWSTWNVFAAGYPEGLQSGTSGRYGQILRNTIFNGGACFWLDAAQILWEENECTGNSPEAMGNAVMEWSGGYTHNIYIGSSSIRQIWGNDREVMTFDGESPGFYGHIANVSNDGQTFTLQGQLPSTSMVGGLFVVLNGTGAGQSRRLISYSADIVTVERPLDVPVGDGMVGVLPFRGRSIFYQNMFEDVGAFQFYGTGVDTIVYGNSMARGGGLMAWGQWAGNYIRPSIKLQFIGNDVREGNHAEHQGTPLGEGTWGPQLQNGGNSFAVVGVGDPTAAAHPEVNRLIDFRRNHAQSNGGFTIGPAVDVVVSRNSVANLPPESIAQFPTQHAPGYVVDPAAEGVLLHSNVSPSNAEAQTHETLFRV